ncbi:MAG: isochorismatase family protein [Alphaproteobacteria bacterium]|nr:isochorismatase family protein [Alphaproteobacteria bacterium]
MLIEAAKSFLLVIDMQERLLPAMTGGAEAEARCRLLVQSARTLGLPVIASEQYPRGLGPTVEALKESLGNAPIFEKLEFSCWRNPALKNALIGYHESGRPQAILAGIEAHVCLLQTALDLAQAGFAVFAVADAMASRRPQSVSLAQARMAQAGVAVVTAEMAVFELLGRAGTAEFKALSGLVR